MPYPGLKIFSDCINSIFFGQVCDTCDGAAIYSLLAAIIRTLTIGVGILAVIGILLTGIGYLKSSGDPTKKNKARSRLINVGIGIIIYIVLFGIAEFFIPGGVVSHPISSTEETASCPEITYTDTTIKRPDSPGSSSGTSSDSTAPDVPILPQIQPKCSVRYKAESESLKINVCRKDEMYLSYVWVKNANQQLRKQYASGLESGTTTLKRAKLGSKIALAFNISEPIHEGYWYSNWHKKNKLYENAEPSPIIIKNGSLIIGPGEGNLSGSHFMSWINSSNQLEYSKRLSTYTKEERLQLYEDIINSGTQNTMLSRAVFIADGKKMPIGEWSLYGGNGGAERDGGVTICQLDTNNYIVITFYGKTSYAKFQEKISNLGCKTAISGDGGGSTETYLRQASGKVITLASTTRGPALFYFTELNQSSVQTTTSANFSPRLESKSYTELESYWINIPSGAHSGMPLVVFLHGDGEFGSASGAKNLPQSKAMLKRSDFISLIPVGIKGKKYWPSSTVKGLIDKIVQEFQIDKKRIYIMGFSRGGLGTWSIADKYPGFFAAAVPMSTCFSSGLSASNFKNTRLRAYMGSKDDRCGGAKSIKSFVQKVSNLGGTAEYKIISGADHSQTSGKINYSDLFDWLLK